MTFAQILGHDRQKEILRRALRTRRLAHAYLFEGPDGVGKQLVALALVRGLFCEEGLGCGDCVPCRKVDHHNHPDLHLLEPQGSSIKIEQVRELQREMAYRPLEAPRKVALIDGADKLNPAAGNALLKTLEEPNGQALFVLLTSVPERVLPTIRSRCQRLPFQRLDPALLERTLVERLGVDATAGHLLAALSEGSFKRALGADRDLFLERRRELLKALTALSPGSILPLFDFAQSLAEEKERLPDILDMFQAFYRDLLLQRHGRPEGELVNIDLMAKVQREAGRETPATLLAKIEAIAGCRRQLERNVNAQLALEVMLMQLAA